MPETLVPSCVRLVGKMSAGGNEWTNQLILNDSGGGGFTGGESPISDFRDFLRGMTPNSGFMEEITGYAVYQTHAGETNVEHPPIFQNTYHLAGTHDANFGGAPVGEALPKDVCMFAKLACAGGRAGKMFIRNLLEEGDVVSAVSGSWVFSGGSTRFTVARFATLVSTTLANNLPGGADIANHQWIVVHLQHTKAGDTRPAVKGAISTITAIRPVWNKAHR